jgi:multidrug efflux pump subunit AcrB
MTKFYDTQKRAIILLAVSLVVGGVFSWNQMPKEEDPRFPNRFGGVTVTYPGADAEGVERLIIRPLERELREVVEIDDISATAITDAAILAIGLNETIYDTEPVWSEVERAVDRARDDFPEGVSSVVLDWQTMDIESITYALTGSDSWMDLREGAMTLEDRLLSVDGVKRVIHSPDLDPHVTIELDPETAGALGIAPELLAGLVGVRSRIIPGGAVRLGTREVAVDTATGYEAVELLEQTLVPVGRRTPAAGRGGGRAHRAGRAGTGAGAIRRGHRIRSRHRPGGEDRSHHLWRANQGSCCGSAAGDRAA